MKTAQALILIIDDEEIFLETMSAALRGAGHRVVSATSGQDGLKQARQHLPDLIISDINMPGGDGCSLLSSIRADRDLATTQLVLMTGNPTAVSPRRGMDIGADDFLVKPFSIEELNRCVTARLQRAQVHWRVKDRHLANLRSSVDQSLPEEFFTPLVSILGLTEVLRGDLTQLSAPQYTELLDHIERAGWHLNRTLRNYLQLLQAKSDPSGNPVRRMALSAEQVSEVVKARVDLVAARHRREADVTLDLAPASLLVRRDELDLIVEELVENAFAYSTHGNAVTVRFVDGDNLIVSDLGRGMTEQQLRECTRFNLPDSETGEKQALKLGLSVVERVTSQCEATLSLNSELGKGTTARVVFRAASL